MRTLSIIVLSIVFLRCNTSKEANNEKQVKTVLGSWEFISYEVSNPYALLDESNFEPKNDSTFNLIIFLGAQTINDMQGTQIEFMSNNEVNWEILKNMGANELDIMYNYNHSDSLLTFDMLIPKNSKKVYIPTRTILRDSVMIWNIEDYMEIKLKRK